jgi:transcription antitermination factor NusA-like protein
MDQYIENVLVYFFGVSSTGALAIWVFRNRTLMLTLAAWFYRTFSWVTKRFEYNNVAYNIEAVVNKAGDKISAVSPDTLPYPIKISWAKTSGALETSLRDGEIVVAMHYSSDRDRNLVVSTLAYLKKGLLPRARVYIDRILMKATDFTVAKDIFHQSGRELAVPLFFDEYLQPATVDNPTLLESLNSLERINNAGFFTRVFLREMKHLGNRVYPAAPSERIWHESVEFSEFLLTVSEKEKGVDIPGGLMFPGSRIRTSLMLVARARTRLLGPEIYLRRIQIDMDRGVEHMYVFARSKANIDLAKEVIAEAEKRKMLHVFSEQLYDQSVDGSDQTAVCYVCSLNILMHPSKEAAPSQTLIEVLEDNILEFREGKIEVVAAARRPGYKSKIAVRSIYKGVDAIKCCSSEERRYAIETTLGETVDFVPWSNDPAELIMASLYPLRSDMVSDVEIDKENDKATIRVFGWKAKRKALGKGDLNKDLAAEITGWKIDVLDVSSENPTDITQEN